MSAADLLALRESKPDAFRNRVKVLARETCWSLKLSGIEAPIAEMENLIERAIEKAAHPGSG